jgi:catechol 2,3-dioxygenase-like lactoylglutathione lyase family enzyme
MTTRIAPRAVTHIGLTVPDIDAAMRWYEDIFGWPVLTPPAHLATGDSGIGAIVADCFGPAFRSVRIGNLATANGAAIEFMEFVDPPTEVPEDTFEYWKAGFTHICVVDPDIEGAVERIVAAGGRLRTAIWPQYAGKPYRMCYVEDPWGTVIELHTHSHEMTHANQSGQ